MNKILFNKVIIVLNLFLLSTSIFASLDNENGQPLTKKRQIENILALANPLEDQLPIKKRRIESENNDDKPVVDISTSDATSKSHNQQQLQKILQAHIIVQITEHLSGADINYLRGTSKLFNNPKVRLLAFQKNIRNTLSQWLVDPVAMFNRIPPGSLEVVYGKDKAAILQGCLLIYEGKYKAALGKFKEKTLPNFIQQQLNKDAYKNARGFTIKTDKAYLRKRVQNHNDTHAQKMLNMAIEYAKLGFTRDQKLSWFFHFYNLATGFYK